MPTERRFKFVDIVAIPNGDSDVGLVDTIGEEELMEMANAKQHG